MQRTNDFLLRHPWATIALSVLAATAVTWLLFPAASPWTTALRACVYCAAGAAFALARRRKEKAAAGGSTDRLVALEHSLRTGEPPTAAGDRRALRETVERRLHQSRHRVTALVFLALLFITVTVLTALTAALPRALALAALSLFFMAWMIWTSNRQTRRLTTMRTALHTDETPAGPAPHHPHNRYSAKE
ncbi:hypothetical protein [Streptomyces bauhiniae]|uniref:hypothetical protein n=1 Tax=Streptomyces bauhiniae TaxID=2340725 RepID=UPI0035DC913E